MVTNNINIYNVFQTLIRTKKTIITTDKGLHFQTLIYRHLEKYGYTNYTPILQLGKESEDSKNLKKIIQDIKPIIQQKENQILSVNNTDVKYAYIQEPYGTQDYPDLLIFSNKYIYPIEVKYVKSAVKNPMWNSNLPKQNGLYIFGSSALREVVFFRGEDVLPENERKILLDVWNQFDLTNWHNDFCQKIQNGEIENKFGFYPYIRKAYTHTTQCNSNANLNFFDDDIIKDLESKLLTFLKEKEE